MGVKSESETPTLPRDGCRLCDFGNGATRSRVKPGPSVRERHGRTRGSWSSRLSLSAWGGVGKSLPNSFLPEEGSRSYVMKIR